MKEAYCDHELGAIVIGEPALPDAIPFAHEGVNYYAYPFTLENAQELAALDYAVQSPIRSGYTFPKVDGRHKHRDMQVETAEFCTLFPRSFVLDEIGTGKTYSAAVAADYLMREGYVRRCVIISPLSTLSPVWADTILKTFSGRRTCNVLHAAADKRKKLFSQDRDFYVINHDGTDVLTEKTYNKKGMLTSAKLMRSDIDLFILDELGMYRHTNTDRWHHLNHMLAQFPDAWIWGLTGTPMPNSPCDVYGQVKLLRPERVPKYYSTFRDLVMMQVNPKFNANAGAANIQPPVWIERPEAIHIAYNTMQPAIRHTRKGNVDIEEEVYIAHEVQLTKEQDKHYKEMFRNFVTEFKQSGQVVSAMNEGVKLSKLLQIACGIVYDQDSNPVAVGEGAKPRLSALKEVMELTKEKVIIYAHYKPVEAWLYRELSKLGPGDLINGDVSKPERDKIFRDFQNSPTKRWIVADPRCMSHGLTLTAASTIVWFGPCTSNDVFTQANGRITRDGQVATPVILMLYATRLEKRRYEILRERGNAQGLLLEMVENGHA